MKKYIYIAIGIMLLGATSVFAASPVTPVTGGGLGTSTIPQIGQVPVGQANGTYAPEATSSLGINGGNFVTYPYASSTFPSFSYASSTYALISSLLNYVQSGYASSTYATINSLLNYLTSSYASTTFPTFQYASSTYYLASNPAGYITSASSSLVNYPTLTYASSTYALVSTGYPTLQYASSTYALLSTGYPTLNYASSTYGILNKANTWTAANTFPNGLVGAPSVAIGGGEGLYQSNTSELGLTNGVSSIRWNGSSFYPGTTNSKTLGTNAAEFSTTYTQNLSLPGTLFDSTNATGTAGEILQSTGTSTIWATNSGGGSSTSTGPVLSLTAGATTAAQNAVYVTNGFLQPGGGGVLNDLVGQIQNVNFVAGVVGTSTFTIPTHSNQWLYVHLGFGSTASTTAVYYNNVPLTKIQSCTETSGGTKYEDWGLFAPTQGSHSLAILGTGSPFNDTLNLLYSDYYQVNQSGLESSGMVCGTTAKNINYTTVTPGDTVIGGTASSSIAYAATSGPAIFTQNQNGATSTNAVYYSYGDTGNLISPQSISVVSPVTGQPYFATAYIALKPANTFTTYPAVEPTSAAATSTTASFIGFAQNAATSTNAVNIQVGGLITGFTGLTTGASYYISNSTGAISTTPGTTYQMAGIAASSTALIIERS